MSVQLSLVLLLVFTTTAISQAAFINQTWTITYKTVLPDGRKKLVPVVNNQYPGPTLRGKVNDIVEITVINRLPTETTTIHWHGIKQTGTPWSDGVPGISQCPIGPGETFVYRFKLDAPGTLWWHSHSGLQKSSLYGAIIIDGDQNVVGKHKDIVLLLNDWYHESGASQIAGLVGVPFRWVGDAQSFLMNGKGDFNCTQADIETEKCDPGTEEKGPLIIDVEPSTTYRLRIVGASSLAFLNFNIDAHKLRMVEAETTLLRPFNTRFLDVGPGQSYSALLRTKSLRQLRRTRRNNVSDKRDRPQPILNTGLFWMQTNIRHRKSGPRGLAILRYSNNSGANEPLRRPPTPPAYDDITWSLKHVRRFRSRRVTKIPPANRTFVYLGTQNRLPNERLVWALNNISYVDGPSPILHSIKMEVLRDTKTYVEQTTIPTPFDFTESLSDAGLSESAKVGTQVVKVKKDEVIDWVFQNTVALAGADEIHPWYVRRRTSKHDVMVVVCDTDPVPCNFVL
ncbi:ascorbate oxidase [Gracilaria domingensis]|nr:ascorbate oxidase [Gracilaria domingensis]